MIMYHLTTIPQYSNLEYYYIIMLCFYDVLYPSLAHDTQVVNRCTKEATWRHIFFVEGNMKDTSSLFHETHYAYTYVSCNNNDCVLCA